MTIWQTVAKTADIPPERVAVFAVDDHEVAVCNVGGQFYAIDDLCTHDGGSLDQGELDEAEIECPLEVDDASYFLSTIDLVLGDSTEMSRWRKRLFLATSRITAYAAEFFHLPRDRTVILGSLIEL